MYEEVIENITINSYMYFQNLKKMTSLTICTNTASKYSAQPITMAVLAAQASAAPSASLVKS